MRSRAADFDFRVTDGAVTDADIWLYDGGSGVAVIGDLVTFPAPFFETACPAAWRKALDEVWAVPFKTAIPGHGEPMTRTQFDAWRGAFNRYMDCVEGTVRSRPVRGDLGGRHCGFQRHATSARARCRSATPSTTSASSATTAARAPTAARART